MSSDTFFVRIKQVNAREVTLDVLAGFDWLDEVARSRSFVLVVFGQCLRQAADEATTQKERKRLHAKAKKNALAKALEGADEDWFVSESWMKANAARFIESCEVVERRNALSENELQKRDREIEEQFGELTTDRQKEWQALRWERCHNYTLRVVTTDAKWAEHLEAGLEFGTTAYDVVRD